MGSKMFSRRKSRQERLINILQRALQDENKSLEKQSMKV